ncbi:hypothetical protein [Actinomadura oligospora]|uniref:hypothetical protein n=1 Tax=Actinomadura oligospora TaxID=111804 RepID=UPI00047EDE78|nr:hypothetical protein [Actinomadura oligospora]
MTGRAVPGASDDARLVEALRTGDVIALSEVYDTFAPSLFDYCHGLLRDRVEAAGALRHCLFAAREHVDALREPQRLRGWLYAIARKESLRRREDPTRSTGQEAPEAGADEMSRQERGRLLERRELAHAALGALDGPRREMLDLAVRHGLTAPDLAKVFGRAPDEADAALREARAALASGLRAALVARRHSRDCADLAALLPRTWPPAPPQARALSEHVASCRVCAAQSVPDLPSDQILGYMPIAAIPADLRLDILNAAASPGRAEARRSAAALSEPLDPDGWPTPYSPRRSKRGRRARANDARPPAPAAHAGGGPGWESPAEAPREDLDRTPSWNAEATAPDTARPAADVIGSGAPDTTLTFDAVPGQDAAGHAPAGGLSRGRGPAGERGRGPAGGGGGRHSRDASSDGGDADGGEQLQPRRSGRIPEDGDRWVAGELRSARGRKRAVLAGAGGVAAVAILGASVAAFAGGGGGGGSSAAKGGHPARPTPSESVVEPSMTGAGSPSGTPTLRPKKGTASPTRTPSETPSSPTSSPKHSHTPPPKRSTTPPSSRPPRPGTLSVTGCSIGFGSSCPIVVTATGGSVSWRVVGVSNGLSASGSGTLAAGQSTTVQVRREDMCFGSRTGQVAFAPSGAAAVSYC